LYAVKCSPDVEVKLTQSIADVAELSAAAAPAAADDDARNSPKPSDAGCGGVG